MSNAKYPGPDGIKMFFNRSRLNNPTQATNIIQFYLYWINPVDKTWFVITILTLITNLSALLIIVCRRNLRILSNAVLCSMFICGCAYAILYLFPCRAMILWQQSSSFVPIISGGTLTACYNLHLCAICIDKIISITSPFRHLALKHRKNVVIVISIIWIIAITFSSILLIAAIQFRRSPYRDHIIVGQILYTFHFVAIIIMPIILTMLLYIVAFFKVNRRNRTIRLFVGNTNGQVRQISKASRNFKIMKQMLAMLGLFTICWLPYCIIIILVEYVYVASIPYLLEQIMYIYPYLTFSYPAINPILFAYFTISIRDEIRVLLAKRFKT